MKPEIAPDRRRELPLAPAFDEPRTHATWQRIVKARLSRRRVRPLVVVGAASALACALVLALVWRHTLATPGPLASRDARLRVEPGAVIGPAAAPLVLDDGSRVTFAAGARLQVLANDGTQFASVLDRGPASFDVTPGGPRRWIIETSLATVEVVGTSFRVEPEADRLVVEVARGVVVVRGDRVPGRVVRLTAGQRVEVLAEPRMEAAVAAAAPVAAPGAAAAAAAAPAAAAAAAPAPAPAPLPREASKPAHAAAATPLSVDAALREADRLRAAGRPAAAAAVLEQALAAAPSGATSGLAWFTLGRLAAEVLGDPDRAERAFAHVIQLGDPASLVEDAYAHRAEALVRAGRDREAEEVIAAFEKAFPADPRARSLRALPVMP